MWSVFEHIGRFVVVVLLQVLFLNNVYLTSWCNPYVYIFFLLSLPVVFPRWADLILGFVLGMTIDVFCNTLGMHTFATVLIAYFRQPIIKLLVSDEEQIIRLPSVVTFGPEAYLKYMLFLTLMHHLTLFALESLTFHHWWHTLGSVLLSVVLSMALMLVTQFRK